MGKSEEWLQKTQGNANYANRGQDLEDMITAANQRYWHTGRALVQKIPTPVKVLDINSRTGKITNGFYEKQSTVDYIGVYDGRGIAFEAKSTNVETRFPLKNIKEHQFQHLLDWDNHRGISFLIVQFKTLDEIYLVPFELLNEYWANKMSGGRKSIEYDRISSECFEIESNGLVCLDYLSALDKLLEDEG